MATFEGTVQDFHHYLGPKIRNAVNVFAKRARKARKGACEHCNGTFQELDSAHVHGKGRRIIIEEVLSQFQNPSGAVRCDVGAAEKEILAKHSPITDVIKFLCKRCHGEYDRSPGIEPPPRNHGASPLSDGCDELIEAVAIELHFFPADEAVFKAQLIKEKKAYFVLYNNDGSATPIKEWNAANFTDASNLRGNIFTGQLRRWRKRGIGKAVFAIRRSDLPISKPSAQPAL
ncbi:hypothetical protein [Microvirga aerophila]|uniref:hypothetical protein n=1 Tax=Microvirga aerophila TaxID=670291 RepID=UPI000DEF843B|nr:hypothetical protein [Microvirga aerophila]